MFGFLYPPFGYLPFLCTFFLSFCLRPSAVILFSLAFIPCPLTKPGFSTPLLSLYPLLFLHPSASPPLFPHFSIRPIPLHSPPIPPSLQYPSTPPCPSTRRQNKTRNKGLGSDARHMSRNVTLSIQIVSSVRSLPRGSYGSTRIACWTPLAGFIYSRRLLTILGYGTCPSTHAITYGAYLQHLLSGIYS